MLHSVTLWRSQLRLWSLETRPDGAYLRHEPCWTRVPLVGGCGPGSEYSLRVDSVVERITGHRCPALPSTTPRLVDGPG